MRSACFLAALLSPLSCLAFDMTTLQMLDNSNAIRESAGQRIAAIDVRLCMAAQGYADHLARTGQMGHQADGGPEHRARRYGFTGTLVAPPKPDGWQGIGEVLAFGHSSIASAFQGWMGSRGHREAVLGSTYDVCGFARDRYGKNIWVGMYGTVVQERVESAQQPQPLQPQQESKPADYPCPVCKGRGTVGNQDCTNCGGTGRLVYETWKNNPPPAQAPTQAPAKGYQQAPAAQCAGGVCYAPARQATAYQARGAFRGGCGGQGRVRRGLFGWRR